MDVFGSTQRVITDLSDVFDRIYSRNGTQNSQLSLFSRQLADMLAQITYGATRVIARNADTENDR